MKKGLAVWNQKRESKGSAVEKGFKRKEETKFYFSLIASRQYLEEENEKRGRGRFLWDPLNPWVASHFYLLLESCLAYSYSVGKVGRDNLNPCNRFLSNSLHEYIVSPLIYSCFGRTSHDDNVFCGSGGTHTSM